MKLHRIIAIVLSLIVCGHAPARAQDLDTELTKLTEGLAGQIKHHGNKKVTVLDFTDLDGNPSEIGKYVADQLTVNFAMNTNREFSVLDRKHLQKIMDEHKLTASGLVDPDNAKKLGQFAGVDAMIFGKVVPVGDKVNVTVTIETTDTAEVTGGGKAKFIQDDNMRQLVSKTAKADADTTNSLSQPQEATTAPKPPPILATQQVGDLAITATKLIKLDNKCLMLNLTLQNKSTRNTIAVALFHDPCYGHPCYLRSTIVAGDGSQFITDSGSLTGVTSSRYTPDDLTPMQPGATVKATITYRPGDWGMPKLPGNIISFTWQADFLINANYRLTDYDNYRPNEKVIVPHCKLQNISLEFQLPRE